MKQREPRRTIQVVARMKSGNHWQDVAIKNVSAHGMKISVALPPRCGSVIEIRRASQIIVARAVWVDDNECGLRTQDIVDVPALLDPNATRAESAIRDTQADRRRGPRVGEAAAHSQQFARHFQYAVMAFAVITGAGLAAWTVGGVLHTPFASISAALGGKPIVAEGTVIRRAR